MVQLQKYLIMILLFLLFIQSWPYVEIAFSILTGRQRFLELSTQDNNTHEPKVPLFLSLLRQIIEILIYCSFDESALEYDIHDEADEEKKYSFPFCAVRIAEVNYKAAIKAKNANAFQQALAYAELGMLFSFSLFQITDNM